MILLALLTAFRPGRDAVDRSIPTNKYTWAAALGAASLATIWRDLERFTRARSAAQARSVKDRNPISRRESRESRRDSDREGKAMTVHQKTKSRTVGDQIAEILAIAGVKRIYGFVGDSLNGLTDAIRHQGKIEWIHVRNEEVGAFAAGAEAHLTGELVVCAGSCGPGNLHLINGLFDCHRSRVPVRAIAAHIPSGEIGSGFF